MDLRFMLRLAVSTGCLLAFAPASSVSAEPTKAKEAKCKPNGYWTLKLKSISGTCDNKSVENAQLSLLITPNRAQQKHENDNAQYGYTDHNIVQEKEITKSILLKGACIVSMDIWPNQVEPYEEEYDMTLVEMSGRVSGVGTLYIRAGFDNLECVQQFSVTGTRSTQVAKAKKPTG